MRGVCVVANTEGLLLLLLLLLHPLKKTPHVMKGRGIILKCTKKAFARSNFNRILSHSNSLEFHRKLWNSIMLRTNCQSLRLILLLRDHFSYVSLGLSKNLWQLHFSLYKSVIMKRNNINTFLEQHFLVSHYKCFFRPTWW